MKLIALNTWGGKKEQDLLSFIRSQKNEIDILCLQEVFKDSHRSKFWGDDNRCCLDLFEKLESTLEGHSADFCPNLEDFFGLATFIAKNIITKRHGDLVIYENFNYNGKDGTHSRKIVWHEIEYNNKVIFILNVHGLWNGNGKNDSDDRLEQSKRIINFLKTLDGEIILCGDFNLLPNTESLQMFEKSGLRNLISEYKVTSTRTSLYTKPDKFADYVFVSKGIQVRDFKVLPDEVSDHSAIFLDFE